MKSIGTTTAADTNQSRGAKAPRKYPKTRKPTGPRPNAGRPAQLAEPVTITARIEATDRDWLLTQAPTVAEAIRNLIAAARYRQHNE